MQKKLSKMHKIYNKMQKLSGGRKFYFSTRGMDPDPDPGHVTERAGAGGGR